MIEKFCFINSRLSKTFRQPKIGQITNFRLELANYPRNKRIAHTNLQIWPVLKIYIKI